MITAITIWIYVVYFILSVDSFKCTSSPFSRKWFGVRMQKSLHSRHIQATNEKETLYDNTYSIRQQVDKLISTQLMDSSLSVKQIQWGKDGLDITLINTINGVKVSPTSDELDSFHKSMYKLSENDANLSAALESLDITVSSPGIGDVLQTDRDFETFKGFEVNVHTSKEHHRQTNLLGKLVERTKEHLFISQKGRKLKIPRSIVVEVKMPPSRCENG